jgi:FkbM family methyltransferase
MIKKFLHYAREHRIYVHSESRKLGIKNIIVGWALIAIAASFFEESYESLPLSLNYCIQFASGTLLLLVACLFKGKSFVSIKSDQIPGDLTEHFTPKQRVWLLWARGLIATGGFMMFVWARNIIGAIDNASLFGADALIYLFLMSIALKEKVSKQEVLWVFVASSGILFVFFADIFSVEAPKIAIGMSCGLLSSLALAIVTLMTSSMVQHDPPLRISFYQCLAGFTLSLVLVLVSLIFNLWGNVQASITISAITDAIGSGCLFAIALIFFLEAFYYAEPLLISALSYSLIPLTIFFDYFILKKIPSVQDMLVTFLITVGCGMLIFYEYKKTRKTSKPRFIPNYTLSQIDHLRSLKQELKNGDIGKYEYMSAHHEYNKVLLQYVEEIKETDLSKISIDDQKILFFTKKNSLVFETDGSCRSAPLEMLNFGEYERDETQFVLSIIKSKDSVLDVGGHIGWYSINIGKKFPEATVYCFEPMKETFDFLERNMKHNNVNNVLLYNFGLYNENRSIDFYYFRGGSALSSPVDLLGTGAKKITVKVKTLDSFAEEVDIKTEITFIKIDVEGCEFAVLKGGESVIRGHKPIIMIELVELWAKKFNYSVNDVREFLEGIGYECFRFSGKKLVKVTEIDTEDTNENYNFFFIDLDIPLHLDRVKQFLD